MDDIVSMTNNYLLLESYRQILESKRDKIHQTVDDYSDEKAAAIICFTLLILIIFLLVKTHKHKKFLSVEESNTESDKEKIIF